MFLCSTYNKDKSYTSYRFYVLSRGDNSGKPMKEPCPNCYVLEFGNEDLKNTFFWLCYGIWKSRGFNHLFRGSVISFMTIKDFKTLLKKHYSLASKKPDILIKTIKAFKEIEKREETIKKEILLLKDAKMLIYRKLIN